TATLPGGTVSVPARLHDNIVTGYALWRSWRDIASPVVLRRWVEEALGRDKRLIDNCRPKMRANGQVRSHPLHGWAPSFRRGMLLSARSAASIPAGTPPCPSRAAPLRPAPRRRRASQGCGAWRSRRDEEIMRSNSSWAHFKRNESG